MSPELSDHHLVAHSQRVSEQTRYAHHRAVALAERRARRFHRAAVVAAGMATRFGSVATRFQNKARTATQVGG